MSDNRQVSSNFFTNFDQFYPNGPGNEFWGSVGHNRAMRINLWANGGNRTAEEVVATLPPYVRDDQHLRYAIYQDMFLLVTVIDPDAPLPAPKGDRSNWS